MNAILRASELGVVAVAFAVAAPARASDGVERSRAEELFYAGRNALDRSDYAEACVDFEQSLALAPRASVLRNLANAEWALGRPVDALKHLRGALERSDLPLENRERAKRDLALFYAATGHLVVRTQLGAILFVDGAPAEGVAPWADPLDVTAGVRQVEVRLGDRVGRAQVDAKLGAVVQVDVNVEAPPTTSAWAPPSAPVPRVASSPSTSEGPSPRRDTLAPPSWMGRRTVGLFVAGVGAASIVVGAAFFVRAADDEHAAAFAANGLGASSCLGMSHPAGCSALSDSLSAQRTDAALSRILVGVGAASMAAGAAILLWPSSAPSALALLPSVDTTSAGFRVRGRF